jgi:hypothetical protein
MHMFTALDFVLSVWEQTAYHNQKLVQHKLSEIYLYHVHSYVDFFNKFN